MKKPTPSKKSDVEELALHIFIGAMVVEEDFQKEMDTTGVPLPETDILLAIEIMWFLGVVAWATAVKQTDEGMAGRLMERVMALVVSKASEDIFKNPTPAVREEFLKGWGKQLSQGPISFDEMGKFIARTCRSTSSEFHGFAAGQMASIVASIPFETLVTAALKELGRPN